MYLCIKIIHECLMCICIRMCRIFIRRYGHITRLEHVVVLLALHAHKIHAYTYMHTHTSVDLPMPPGPQSTHLFVVASLLSNQSRMPFSSLDRRWKPFGALTLNTRIATTLSLSPRAAGAWRAAAGLNDRTAVLARDPSSADAWGIAPVSSAEVCLATGFAPTS